MNGLALYNEIDDFAAAWLEQLIAAGQIAPGIVDRRSIEDLDPDYVRQFTQVHFFAGIGVWSRALRDAGWPDDRPIWTGSCPCQPFSAAGKGGGFDDERHLWPAFHWLIEQCRPDVVLGEQVASKDGLAWFDLVSSDLEASSYAAGAADTCAAGFGAPHIRQRLYWCALADADDARLEGRGEPRRERAGKFVARSSGLAGGLGNSNLRGRESSGLPAQRSDGRDQSVPSGHGETSVLNAPATGRGRGLEPRSMADADGGLADAEGDRHEWPGELGEPAGRNGAAHGGAADRPGPTNGFWRAADWLLCRDGRWRPVEPETFPLADAGTFRNRVGLLRGAGNAINLAQATGFCEVVKEYVDAA